MAPDNSLPEKCRLCGINLPEKPVYQLHNQPARIQFFPTPETLDRDTAVNLDVFQCSGCGHIQLATQPIIYAEEFTSATKYSQPMMDYRRQQLGDFVQTYGLQNKSILDVGCGDGHLLAMFDDLGTTAIGIDASPKALEVARQHGHTAHFGYVSREFQIPDGPFDGFVCFDVVEHVPDIKDFVQGIAANLKPGAVGLLETPSFEKVLETSRWMDFVQDHLSYFTRDTLRLALELGGFEILDNERNRDGENLTIIIRKRAVPDFDTIRARQAQLTDSLSEFLKQQRQAGKRVALWGAGLQTLVLAATTSLDIAYIIDSAPYKQGKLTPVSHLPIVSPDKLKTDLVDVIIINAPRYHDEIMKQIKEKEGFTGSIAILVDDKIETLQ